MRRDLRATLLERVRPLVQQLAEDLVDRLADHLEANIDEALEVARAALAADLESARRTRPARSQPAPAAELGAGARILELAREHQVIAADELPAVVEAVDHARSGPPDDEVSLVDLDRSIEREVQRAAPAPVLTAIEPERPRRYSPTEIARLKQRAAERHARQAAREQTPAQPTTEPEPIVAALPTPILTVTF